MADANSKVMEMIEAELKKNADISNAELFEKATKIDKDIGKLSPRQFNARYPLQVKRAMKPRKRKARGAKSGRGKGSKSSGRASAGARTGARSVASRRNAGSSGDASRDRVRAVLLELARDIANAEGKGDVVDVVAGIDRYVDRVVKAG